MDYRYLGKSGLNISALSLGSWINFGTKINSDIATQLIKFAYDQGINFFDNAELYENGLSEIIMGDSLKKLGLARDTYCVSSKVFWGGDKPTQLGLSAKHIRDGCDNALKRMHLDYIDLFFCHRPDKNTPIEEIVHSMNVLINRGKILYWGTSEWDVESIISCIDFAINNNLVPPVMEQPQYNMLHRNKVDKEFVGLFDNYNYGITSWSPLASGVLSGKYNKDIPSGSRLSMPQHNYIKEEYLGDDLKEKNINKIEHLATIADKLGATMSQMAIAWCLQNNNVSTVILGASNLSQLEENIQAIKLIESFDDGILDEIESILDNDPSKNI